MTRTSNPDDVDARLRSRMAAERWQIEKAAASELRRSGARSRAVVNDELHSIEAVTAAGTARIRVILLNAWLRPLVAGLVIFLGISGGSWGLTHSLSTNIQSRIETLDVQIEHARDTLAEIEETTWAVTLLATDRGRFVVLPEETLDHPPWTVGGRPALKLPSE